MAKFIEIKSVDPKVREDRLAKQIGCSNSTLQRNRHDINLLSPNKISSNIHKTRLKASSDLRRPQMTLHKPNPVVDCVTETVAPVKLVKTKNKLKGGGNIEIDHEYSDEILHKSY